MVKGGQWSKNERFSRVHRGTQEAHKLVSLFRWLMPLLVVFLALGMFKHPLYALASPPVQRNLIFLNDPERVRQGGTLFLKPYNANTSTRVFYHYLNCTGAKTDFVVTTSGEVTCFGAGNSTHYRPEVAGYTATRRYFTTTATPPRTSRGELLRIALDAGDTVSGVFDFASDSPGAMRVAMVPHGKTSDGAAMVPKSNALFSQTVNQEIELKPGKSVRIGAGGKRGEYGIVFSIKFDAAQCRLEVSPRGGPLSLVYMVGSAVKSTGCIHARGRSNLLIEAKGPTVVRMMPQGGSSYPLEIKAIPLKHTK